MLKVSLELTAVGYEHTGDYFANSASIFASIPEGKARELLKKSSRDKHRGFQDQLSISKAKLRELLDKPLEDWLSYWLMIEIRNAAGDVTYRNSFITDLPVDRDTVVDLAACGRARWKIENESFNILKTKGYNLEHNFGHGKQHLSAVLAILNLLAFTFHTVAELTHDLWLQAINKTGARNRFFERLRSITVFLVFPSWQHLL